MRTIVINVDAKESGYVERLDYERGFTKDVLQRIIEAHMASNHLASGAEEHLRLIRNRERNWMHSSAWQ